MNTECRLKRIEGEGYRPRDTVVRVLNSFFGVSGAFLQSRCLDLNFWDGISFRLNFYALKMWSNVDYEELLSGAESAIPPQEAGGNTTTSV
eukprot:scaffold8452_cov185-Ochromonas_danica.AAC.5